jgi:major membrane immunogen (membrane-anchored lipoprotein)
MEDYARQLVAAQELADVDAIAGATIAFGQFEEAVTDALDKAGA